MSLDTLEAWLDAHGVKRSRGLDVVQDESGWSVFAKRNYALGEICECSDGSPRA